MSANTSAKMYNSWVDTWQGVAMDAREGGAMSGEFSIGTLAERTGLSPTVLRTWENRFGFPTGRRTPSGHRRFTDVDVRLVQEVQRSRESGVPLHLAIDAVVRRESHVAQDSVHATLV